MQPERIHVVMNARSGKGHADESVRELERHFAEKGLQATIHTADGGEGILAAAKKALQSGADVLVAAGGDGTVSALASCVRGTSTTLAVLPMGTLNHFARDLGIPTDIGEAVATIASGQRIAVDMGQVNGHDFVNNASLGLYPDIVRDRTRRQRRLGHAKYWAMFLAMLSVMNRSPFLRLAVDIEGKEAFRYRSPFVFIGNNDYVMEGFDMGQRASLRDGHLSIYTTTRCTRLGLLALAVRALFGRLRQADDFATAKATTMQIDSTRRRLLVATDGEVTAMETPLKFRVLPGALQVIAPATPA